MNDPLPDPVLDEAAVQAPLGAGRTDPDTVREAPPTHAELPEPIVIPTLAEVLGARIVQDSVLLDEAEGEETSARVASTAARLLAMPNPLMRASPYHAQILAAVKDHTKHGVTGEMLDLLEKLALVLEPLMRDVRTVAGSALTQVQSVVDESPDV